MHLLETLAYIVHHPLNRRRKAEALLRWLKWQVGSRLVSGPAAIRFVNNSVLLVGPGMTGATGNIYCGLHEFEEMSFVLHALRSDDLFIDIGANVGSYTTLASAVVGARTIAVEPIPETFERLRRNIAINFIQHLVEAHNIGVSSEDGIARFTAGLDTVNHVAGERESLSDHLLDVQVRALDRLVAGKQPTIIKIDVEGFETNVVSGARNTLSEVSLKAVVMELNGSGKRYGFDEDTLHRNMLDYGFKTFSYFPFERKLESMNEKKSDSGNTIYIRDAEFIKARVSSAPKYSVHGRMI